MKGALAAFVTAIEAFVAAHAAAGGSIAMLVTSDEEGPSIDGTASVVERLAAGGRDHRLLHRRRADVGGPARRHDQERPARHALGNIDRQGHSGPRRLSAPREESDPSGGTRSRRARRDAMGRRQCPFSADDVAVLEHPRRHRRDQRDSRHARGHVQFPVLPGQHPRVAGAALRGDPRQPWRRLRARVDRVREALPDRARARWSTSSATPCAR